MTGGDGKLPINYSLATAPVGVGYHGNGSLAVTAESGKLQVPMKTMAPWQQLMDTT